MQGAGGGRVVIGEPGGAGEELRILEALDRLADEFCVSARRLLLFRHRPITP